ncbi:MAG: Crp/Fnr family transcriptional regulator [Parvibaculum sp.]|uniref:Crp/Fnr family transcriptional regulator n=1 Tax=Parvibaculum sp. TaxID=2024848 RepID=UPI0025D575AB|nr:Crp/Fnr family transcriptional regulator [Parvibaculum sp.]MCE9650738.1 Crp/Fnr family transcriptional regulator [Parvibaculum sp.]
MNSSKSVAKPLLEEGAVPQSEEAWSECADCPLRDYRFCAAYTRTMPNAAPRLPRLAKDVVPRQNLYRAKEPIRQVALVREGMAFRYVLLPDGNRQILSFCLPGDFLIPSVTVRDTVHFSVQALTPMRLCVFDKEAFRAHVAEDRHAMMSMAEICIGEKENCEARIVDLGRRGSEERVARFILDLMSEMQRRDPVKHASISFPMRQQHIADALGLTQVHVSRVLGRFRKEGLISLAGGTLAIIDAPNLQNLAGGQRD